MGKEWYWVGKSSKRTTTLSTTTTSEETQQETPSGCMCAVFHFFDFHPFHFPSTLNHHQQQQTSFKSTSEDNLNTIIPKGVEAPRNSLESEDGSTTISSISKEDNFKIPKNIQIKTIRERNGGNLNGLSSEISSSSPGIKTPTLVARLMGLDLLPDSESPSFSTPKTQGNPNNNIPNLHHLRTKQYIQTKHRNSIDSSEITRISSTRKSDVFDHHRLSLQINKENLSEEFELPRFSFSKKKFDENKNDRSPSSYARQIVKQVKESVSRKVGQDITNTRELEFGSPIRVKKCSKTSSLETSNASSSCSPRLRFIDTKQKTTTLKDQNTQSNVVKVKLPSQPFSTPVVNNIQPKVSRVVTKTKGYALVEEKKLVPKCNKGTTNEEFSSRLKRPLQTIDVIRNKQEETFIIRSTSPTRANDVKSGKSKRTQPLSSNLPNNINNVPNLVVVKTDNSPMATKIPQKQSQEYDTQEDFKHCSQLSSCLSQRYKQEGTTTTILATQDNLNGGTSSTTTGGASLSQLHKPEFQYIKNILNRTKSAKTNTTTTLFSPKKHPLDPSIFNHLEHQFNDKDPNFITKNQLGHRWNRRLMFDLVDEVLMKILSPKEREKKLSFSHGFCEDLSVEELTKRVWKRVEEFPCAKCEVLEDIDKLIENEDMEKAKTEMEEKEERENLVTEIEGKILDTLVHEMVMVMDCFRKTK